MEQQRQEMITRIKDIMGESRIKFILKRGVLYFGIPVALFTPMVREAMSGTLNAQSYAENFTGYALGAVIFNALVAGAVFGYYQWWKLKSTLKKLEDIGKTKD